MTLPGCTCEARMPRFFDCPWHGLNLEQREKRDRLICGSGLTEILAAMLAAGFDAARGRDLRAANHSPVLFRHANGEPGAIVLRPYSSSSRTYRVKIDHGTGDASHRALARFGLTYSCSPLGRSPWQLELTMLEAEIRAVAGWLPRFLRQSPRVHELPPVPMVQRWHGPPYAWTAAALAQHEAWTRRRGAA